MRRNRALPVLGIGFGEHGLLPAQPHFAIIDGYAAFGELGIVERDQAAVLGALGSDS
jgi:hypothetical protein